jgi:hypothetical protein
MPGSDRRSKRTFERDGVLANGGKRLFGDELPAGFDRFGANDLPLPLDGRFGSFTDLNNSVGDLRTDSIARNKGNSVRFHFLIVEQSACAIDLKRILCVFIAVSFFST